MTFWCSRFLLVLLACHMVHATAAEFIDPSCADLGNCEAMLIRDGASLYSQPDTSSMAVEIHGRTSLSRGWKLWINPRDLNRSDGWLRVYNSARVGQVLHKNITSEEASRLSALQLYWGWIPKKDVALFSGLRPVMKCWPVELLEIEHHDKAAEFTSVTRYYFDVVGNVWVFDDSEHGLPNVTFRGRVYVGDGLFWLRFPYYKGIHYLNQIGHYDTLQGSVTWVPFDGETTFRQRQVAKDSRCELVVGEEPSIR